MARARRMNGKRGVLSRIAAKRRRKVRKILESNDEPAWDETKADDCDSKNFQDNDNEGASNG